MDKRECRKPRKCTSDGFAFRKAVIPAALGDDITGQDKPANGAYTNTYVEYEANGAQYMYDSFGVYTKLSDGEDGVNEFDDLLHRPFYAGEEMTSETSIPDVVAIENNLQSQIDALSAAASVADVVGTYADLEAYDTSRLKNDDLIKVLQDETRGEQTTYYRWSKLTEMFSFVGSEGPYYTKAVADERFQHTLTPGDNIQIVDNTISATDTTYADFVGTDGASDGFAGLVPAPSSQDQGKFLNANGGWESSPSYSFEDTETGWKVTSSDGDEFSHDDMGSNGELTQDITVNNPIGRYHNGDTIEAGTSFETIFRRMLTNVYYPTLTNPSATLTYTMPQYVKVGSTISARAATLSLNRGSINPQYTAESGYRSGPATNYTLSTVGADVEYDSSSTSSGSFAVDALTRATKGTIVLTGTINYSEGAQPKDSDGNDYQSPLPAGSVTASKTATFIQPFYWGVSSSSSVSDFTGLTENVSPKSNKVVAYTTTNQYMVFAYDSSYGDLSSILDPNAFETISGWNKSTLTVDGFTYNVYVSASATTDTDAEFTFKF